MSEQSTRAVGTDLSSSIQREMRDALALYEQRTGRSATALERAQARGAAFVVQVMEGVR